MVKPTTIAYVDCFSGVSGDMLLGALLDGGLPLAVLEKELAGLGLGNLSLSVQRQREGAIVASHFRVESSEDGPSRNWRAIRELLLASDLVEPVRDLALAIFTVLAEAEAGVHGCPLDEVHFHEVGGVDAIVDIVGAAVGFHALGIEELVASPLPMARGWVDCAHGPLPLPAPAVCEILKDVPVYGVDLHQELVTPTGAAVLKGVACEFGEFPAMRISRVGYGAGSQQRADKRPNLLRLVIGERRPVPEAQEIQVIETNLDDWAPETFPHLVETLLAQGCLDVSLVPIQMKKGRPGFLLRVIAEPGPAWEIKKTILSETTAIGLRFRVEQRMTLARQIGTVETPWGRVRVKRVEAPAGPRLSPEYEDCRRLAALAKVPLRTVYEAVGRCRPEDFKTQGEIPCP